MAISATMQGEEKTKFGKIIKDEMPLIKLVPVKMPLSEFTNEMKKEEVKNGPPFYVANVFDGSPSTKAYVGLALGISKSLEKYFGGQEGFEISAEYLPSITGGPVGDRDNYLEYFGRIIFSDLSDCSLMLYGDGDPGGGGTLVAGDGGEYLDYVIRKLNEKNIKVHFVYLEDRAQEKKEYGHVEERVKNAQKNLETAKKEGDVRVRLYDRSDTGKKRTFGTERKNVEECERGLKAAMRSEREVKERKSVIQKLCEGTGGKLILVADEELAKMRGGSKQAKEKSAYEIESRVLDVILNEQKETEGIAPK